MGPCKGVYDCVVIVYEYAVLLHYITTYINEPRRETTDLRGSRQGSAPYKPVCIATEDG